MIERSCGECTACCTILGVEEISKRPGHSCLYQHGGCLIYDRRPSKCKSYECAWLAGGIPGDENRPDKLGVMFSRVGGSTAYSILSGTLCVQETRPGALDEPPVLKLLAELSDEVLLSVFRGSEIILLGPEDKIAEARKVADKASNPKGE